MDAFEDAEAIRAERHEEGEIRLVGGGDVMGGRDDLRAELDDILERSGERLGQLLDNRVEADAEERVGRRDASVQPVLERRGNAHGDTSGASRQGIRRLDHAFATIPNCGYLCHPGFGGSTMVLVWSTPVAGV